MTTLDVEGFVEDVVLGGYSNTSVLVELRSDLLIEVSRNDCMAAELQSAIILDIEFLCS